MGLLPHQHPNMFLDGMASRPRLVPRPQIIRTHPHNNPMPTTEEQQNQHAKELNAWRLLCLLNAGYTHHRAELIANRNDIDLHHAINLLEHGCPQTTALKILL